MIPKIQYDEKLWAGLLIAGGIILAYFLIKKNDKQITCSTAPIEYQQYCIDTNLWLDSKIVEWKPQQSNTLKFNGHLIFFSENSINSFPQEYDDLFIDMILELNSNSVSLHIQPTLYKTYNDRYDNIISKIKASGKELYIAYVMPTSASITLEQYVFMENEFISSFISTYKPEYFVVVDEYLTMMERTGLVATVDEWKNMVINFVNLTKSINPDTKTIVTGHQGELDFLNSLYNVNNLDYVGINVWGIDMIDETTVSGTNVKNTIQYLQSYGKGIIFEQTWSFLITEGTRDISVMEFMKDIDSKYTESITYYCLNNGIINYSPYFTGKFIIYSEDINAGTQALINKDRTPIFYKYQQLIMEYQLI